MRGLRSQKLDSLGENQSLLKTLLDISFRTPQEIKDADIIHFTYYMPSKLLNNKRLIKVSTIHDFIPERHHSRTSIGRYSHFSKHQYIKKSNGLIFVSDFTKKLSYSYSENIESKPNRVIYHGVKSGAVLGKQKPKIKNNYFLYVGKRSKYKNFEFILKVFSKISKQKNIVLVCFGGGKLEKSIDQLINKYDVSQSVVFVDDNDYELENLYQNAIAFINPSQEEGFGMTNLEALSNGCPVICSDIAVFKEILGEHANYFSLNSSNSLFIQLNKFINETCSIKQREVLIKKSQEYSWSQTARFTADFYSSLLD
jgi:glycosyltransferase involved in cell wall biosynthesis